MRRLLSLTVLCALLIGVLPATAHARQVKGGEIVVGEGAAGVKLGMTRAEVVGLLGKPFYENKNGYMQYSGDTARNIFDVYLDTSQTPDRVRMVGVADGNFRIEGIPVFRRGALRRLMRRYGSELKPKRLPTRDPVYRITTQYQGREVWTDLSVIRHSPRARVMQVFILFV